IYKRTWRAMKQECRQQAELNKLFFHADVDFQKLTAGPQAMVRPDDYSTYGLTVRPAADPYVVSDTQRVEQAKTIVGMSGSLPGFNRYKSQLRLLKAMNIPDIEEVFPQPMTQGQDGQMVPAQDFPPPGPDPKMLEVQIKMQAQQLKQAEFQAGLQEKRVRLQADLYTTVAKIADLQADAALKASQAKGAEVDPAIKLIYAEIEAQGSKRQHLLDLLDIVTRNLGEKDDKGGNGLDRAGMAGLAAVGANAGVPVPVAPVGVGNPGGLAQ